MKTLRLSVVRFACLLAGCFTGLPAAALTPARPWYEHAASSRDLDALNGLACVPRGTHLESASLGSNFQQAEEHPDDLRGEVTCSPHEVSDALIWRRLPFCTWKSDRWACQEGRVAADFMVKGEWLRLAYYEPAFSRVQLRKLAADLFRLGVAGAPRHLLAHGPCSLRRDRADTSQYVSMDCADQVFGIDERCRGDVCRYSVFWSDRRR